MLASRRRDLRVRSRDFSRAGHPYRNPENRDQGGPGDLRVNADALLDQGIRYVRAGRERGRGTSHNDLARLIRGEADDPVWGRLQDELARSTSRINVISAEGLWLRDPAMLKHHLPDVGDVKIVVYLRRQDRYLQSLYMQTVASGRAHSFAEWRENVPDRGKYLDCVDDWAEAFGDDAIVHRPMSATVWSIPSPISPG